MDKFEHADICAEVDTLVDNLIAGEKPDFDEMDQEHRDALLARVREKIDELKAFNGKIPLVLDEHFWRYNKQINALCGLALYLDPSIAKNLASQIARFFNESRADERGVRLLTNGALLKVVRESDDEDVTD